MQIASNIEHLNKIKQTSLATKYPHLISAALTDVKNTLMVLSIHGSHGIKLKKVRDIG